MLGLYILKAMNRAVFSICFLTICVPIATAESFDQALSKAVIERTKHEVRYDASYVQIGYPGGDVSENTGVCTDVVIRSYRAIGADLQRLVHEDMAANFQAYPSRRIWGLKTTDRNIDHRRVPNLRTFFQRNGRSLPITDNPADYEAGHLVTWVIPGNLPHIGIVTDVKHQDTSAPLIVHNIGDGPVLEDVLFDYPITGHYRYEPPEYNE